MDLNAPASRARIDPTRFPPPSPPPARSPPPRRRPRASPARRSRAQALPDDPADQLELAHRIANLAYVSKVQSLERDNADLREQAANEKMRVKQLERRVNALDAELAEAADKAVLAMEERDKLHGEKTALINTVKKLNREVAKLDAFKRNLMQTLEEEEDQNDPVGAGDAAGERLVSSVLREATHANAHVGGDRSTPYRSSRITPPGSPARSVGGSSAAARSPSRSKNFGAGGGAGSAAASPAAGAGKVDGKEFFRRARARLSYERFSQFLQNIKDLNAHKRTRAETLQKAREIFGETNDDLYETFETLLVKHLPK